MSAQQISLIPELNRSATEKKVKEALEKARLFIQVGYHPGIEVSTTAGYNIAPPSHTNQFHSSTENAAIKNVDIERERKEHVQRVITAVKRLEKRERELILIRWFGDEDKSDIETYMDLCLSPATYYRIRSRAFLKLALALRLEVFKGIEK